VASVVFPYRWEFGSALYYVSVNYGRKERVTVDGEEPLRPHSDEEVANFIQSASELASDTARCRMLVGELQRAHESIR
jgi:hypothetical protein